MSPEQAGREQAGRQRARPRYGEYASPEEQAAGIRDPEARRRILAARSPHGQDAPSTVPAAAGAEARIAPGVPRRQDPAASRGHHQAPGATPRPRARWDTVLTFVLLGAGLADVAGSVPGYLHLGRTVAAVFEQFGVAAAPSPPGAATAGAVLIAVRVVLWLAAAGLAAWRVRIRRSAFWIPLLGALASYLAVVIVMMAVVFTSPAFQTFLESR